MFARRTPFMAQMEATECGAACLSMVLGHFGHHAELIDVRTACGVSRDGTTAAAIMRAARAYGLEGRATRVEPAALGQGALPAILHWDFNHFVVLTKVSRRGLHVLDPAFGARLVSWSEADRLFTGVRLTFNVGKTFRKRARRSSSLRRYWGVLRNALAATSLLVLAAFTLEIVGLVFPILSQVAIDFVVRPRQSRFLFVLILLLAGAVTLRFVLALARQRVATGLRVNLDWCLRMGFTQHLVRLPLIFFGQRSSGDLASRAAGHEEIRAILQSLSTTALDALLVVSYLGLMLIYDVYLGAAVLVLTCLRVLLVMALQAQVRDSVSGEVVASAGESAVVDETFTSSEAIQSLGVQDAAARRYLDFVTQRLNRSVERRRIEQYFLQFAPLLDALTLALIYWVGGRRVMADQLTLGVLAAFVAMVTLLARPLAALVEAASRIPSLLATARRIDDVWAAAPEVFGNVAPGLLSGAIHLRNVSFAYGSAAAPAVRDVSLDLAPGERIALVGASGSGKSSLASLIAGLEAPSAGTVYLGSQPLRALERALVCEQVGVVFADSLYFSGTLRENLELGKPRTFSELERAARLACIHEEIVALPDGYETRLDNGGAPLSGGQRQRLALARALLGAPRIVILDEATSSVDQQLEAQILANLRGAGSTQILVSHRASAIRQADRIVVMATGSVVDQGSR